MKTAKAAFALLAACALLGACSHTKSTASANPGCPDKDEPQAMAGRKVSDGEMGNVQKVAVVNSYCPIAGSHGVPGKMAPASLTRDYKGQKVGFCCDGCPPVWDKMSDQQKQAALDAVMAREKTMKQ
jgi:hypothetical protein